jgi:hypothetical protein
VKLYLAFATRCHIEPFRSELRKVGQFMKFASSNSIAGDPRSTVSSGDSTEGYVEFRDNFVVKLCTACTTRCHFDLSAACYGKRRN